MPDDALTSIADTLASSKSATAANLHPSTSGPRFERGRELGRGGMGRVVEAIDHQFNRTVAIKELSAPGADDQQRFLTEALVTGNLEHPGIPCVYERGVDERGVPWFAMRKIQGRTLSQLLGETTTLPQRLALLPSLIRVAQTLAYAQERGVVHRDVKPDNIIVGAHGDVILLDWGIARVRGALPTSASDVRAATSLSTMVGSVVGTPAYMAPEQALGRTDEIDERSDVFALGAVLYHLLTGRPPYVAATVHEAVELARRTSFPPVRELAPAAPEELAAVCARAMSSNASERFKNAGELAHALEAFEARALTAPTGSRVVSVVTVAIIAGCVLGALAIAAAMLPRLAFSDLGDGAAVTVIMTLGGLVLSGLEGFTRGRHRLGDLALALALATVCVGFASASSGVTSSFVAMKRFPELQQSQVLLMGLRETIGNITAACLSGALQLLAWGISRRLRVQPTPPATR